MKIKTMTATFGKLQGERLTLEPGLNIITAPNEGGKSTWCAFLKAMFYGIDTRDRDRKGHLADKNRYQPWSGTPMEGEVTLEWQGRDITIRRGPRGSVPFGTFSAVYTGTEEPVPGLTADTCGQMLLGVGREVYERSAFIGQSGTLAIRSAPELEARIAALVSSGEEDVSYSQVERQLKEWLNRRKVNKSVGRIPQLEGERAELTQRVDEMAQLNGQLNQLEGERAQAARRHAFCTQQLDLHKAMAQRKLDEQYTQAQAEEAQAQTQLDALLAEQARFGTLPSREELKRAQGELAFLKALEPEIRQGQEELEEAQQALEQARQAAQDKHFPGMTGEEAVRKGEQDGAGYHADMEKQAAGRRNFVILQALGVIAGVALAVFGPLWWLGIIAYAVCAAVSAMVWAGGTKAARQAERILARYGVDQVDEIADLAGDYQQRVAAADQAAQQVQMIQGGLADRQARLENSRRELFQFVHAFAPEVKELFGVSAALSRALNLEERETLARSKLEGAQRLTQALRAQGGRELTEEAELPTPTLPLEQAAQETGRLQVELERLDRALNQARGKQQALGDPAALSAQLEQVEEELDRRNREYQAISIAMETLQQANAQLQQRFSPQLNRAAGALLDRLTGGKYQTLSLDKELDASAAGEQDVLPHSALYLSKGTVDQIYLAVRLAVCDLCLPDAPLVLDDPEVESTSADGTVTTLKDGTEIHWIINPNQDGVYQQKLDEALLNQASAADDDKVDIFLSETDYVFKYTDADADVAMPLTDLGIDPDTDLADQYAFTRTTASDQNGVQRGSTWQCCPGLLVYRRDIAKDVFGTDDPAAVGEKVKDWDTLKATAEELKAKGYYTFASYADTFRLYGNSISEPWVTAGETTVKVDPQIMNWIKDSKEWLDAGYFDKTVKGQWNDDWNKSMSSSSKVFAFLLPAWGIDFTLNPNWDGETGAWGVTNPPQEYNWGGSYIHAATGTDNPQHVKDIILALTANKDNLIKISRDYLDFTNTVSGMQEAATDASFASDFLGGQNAYEYFAPVAENIQIAPLSSYDQGCVELIQNAFSDYFQGNVDYDRAKSNFETAIKERYPDVTEIQWAE